MPRKKQTTGDPVQAAAAKTPKVRKPKSAAPRKTKPVVRAQQSDPDGEHTQGFHFEQDPQSIHGKPKMGRPTEYHPKFVAVARQMCSMGATDDQLAKAFEVDTFTIQRWQATHKDFCGALKVDKGEFDSEVERSLAQRARGFTRKTVKIFMPAGATAPVYAEHEEYYPPDPGACKLWLCNRQPDKWRDRKELTGAEGAPLVPVMNVLYGGVSGSGN